MLGRVCYIVRVCYLHNIISTFLKLIPTATRGPASVSNSEELPSLVDKMNRLNSHQSRSGDRAGLHAIALYPSVDRKSAEKVVYEET